MLVVASLASAAAAPAAHEPSTSGGSDVDSLLSELTSLERGEHAALSGLLRCGGFVSHMHAPARSRVVTECHRRGSKGKGKGRGATTRRVQVVRVWDATRVITPGEVAARERARRHAMLAWAGKYRTGRWRRRLRRRRAQREAEALEMAVQAADIMVLQRKGKGKGKGKGRGASKALIGRLYDGITGSGGSSNGDSSGRLSGSDGAVSVSSGSSDEGSESDDGTVYSSSSGNEADSDSGGNSGTGSDSDDSDGPYARRRQVMEVAHEVCVCAAQVPWLWLRAVAHHLTH